jgi:lysophospholipase L1-like esterase
MRGWLVLAGLAAMPAQAQTPPALPAAASAITETPCTPARSFPDDWPMLCHYHAANRTVAAPPRAVMIGDSITEMWITTAPALFGEGVIDRGISGQTSPQMVARFYQDVVRLRPRVVHIMAGTNDIAGNTGPSSPEDYANAITAMIDMARANGIAVVLGSIPPAGVIGWRQGYRPAQQIIAFNAWLRALAAERGLVYADYHSALADADGAMKPGLSSDGVHPTAAGFAVMEPIARAAIAEVERRLAGATTSTR